ncbi:MAG: CopG family transcriptional regulator [Candidatus Aminicenantes bacterium]|nr:MAG: CopG family transcriptional regulator [Candidatus Aminicenantes bacterium]
MSRAVKFTVSVPEMVFKALEARRRKTGKSRSQLVRDAILGLGSKAGKRPTEETAAGGVIREGSARYGAPAPSFQEMTDKTERRRRAIAAAGRFRSGAPDLSTDHDKYLDEAYAAVSGPGSGRKP